MLLAFHGAIFRLTSISRVENQWNIHEKLQHLMGTAVSLNINPERRREIISHYGGIIEMHLSECSAWLNIGAKKEQLPHSANHILHVPFAVFS